MTTLWRLVATGPLEPLRAANTALSELDPSPALGSSVFEDADPSTGRFDILFGAMPDTDAILSAIGLSPEGLEIDCSPLPEEDWVRLSLAGLKPVEAGRFVVYGAHDKHLIDPARVGIEIEAGPAFGTGHHGTTKGCLIACDQLAETGFTPGRVLDLGAGTAVLAIAAALVWPEAVILASDIDPDAVAESVENIEKNAATDRIDPFVADGFDHEKLKDARFDLIFANILAGPLQVLARQLAAALSPGGFAVLSGLLEEQIAGVTAAYADAGLEVSETNLIDGWAILTLRHA